MVKSSQCLGGDVNLDQLKKETLAEDKHSSALLQHTDKRKHIENTTPHKEHQAQQKNATDSVVFLLVCILACLGWRCSVE